MSVPRIAERASSEYLAVSRTCEVTGGRVAAIVLAQFLAANNQNRAMRRMQRGQEKESEAKQQTTLLLKPREYTKKAERARNRRSGV
eukprot:3715629-Rhodomonas_salina.6